MRRTQARQCDLLLAGAEPRLADLHCRVCGVCLAAIETAVIALGRNDNGAIERGYCDVPHATADGWPWIKRPADRASTRQP